MAEIQYQRLTWNRAKFGISMATRSSLWLGPDHLLFVETTGYTETYKRFYFRDIQAISVRETGTFAMVNGILGIIFGAAMIPILLSIRSGDGIVIFWLVFVLLLLGLPLALNIIWGPTCTSFLRTAVQTQEMASLARVRKTRRILNRIRPLIAAAQGEISAEEVSARLRGIPVGTGVSGGTAAPLSGLASGLGTAPAEPPTTV